MLKRVLAHVTDRLFELPILVLMPHSRCNCRCVMCDIWKANQEKREITVEELEKHISSFRRFHVRRVALSGGEALMHSNLWKFCDALRGIGIKISLLSTGITLEHHAQQVVAHCDDVIVSIDGPLSTHNKIRNIPAAFEKLEKGVKALKTIDPFFRVTGRTVLQKQNFRDFPDIVRIARTIGLNQISFLAADVSSSAFNRPDPWTEGKKTEVALNQLEAQEFEDLMRKSFNDLGEDLDSKFIAESKKSLLDICQYYKAMTGHANFPTKRCNAPWVSAVIESNGDVLPCFFHKPYGNIYTNPFDRIVNSQKAVAFRRQLKIEKDPVCKRCVCSLYLGITQPV